MFKKTLFAGILCGILFTVWTFVVNGIFGFQSRIEMKPIPQERQIYEVLKQTIQEPGRYICNPELTPEGRFPEGEPVFSILYSGFSHDAAGSLMLIELLFFFLVPLLAAWLLSQASERILSSFLRKVLFFSVIGILFAISTDLSNLGIGGSALTDSLLLCLNRIVIWTLMGLVAAMFIKPMEAETKKG